MLKIFRKKNFYIVFLVFVAFVSTSCEQSKQTFYELNTSVDSDVMELVAPPNTMLLDVNVSNQPFIVVKKLIKNKNEEIKEKSFNIIGRDKTYTIKYSEIDYALSEQEIVDKIKNGEANNLAFTYNEQKLTDVLNSIRNEENKVAKNASIKKENGQLITSDGQIGSVIEEEPLKTGIEQALNLTSNEVKLSFIEETPQYNKDVFNNFVLIGSYQSKYRTTDYQRNKNLQQASNKINNVVLYPGEVFSTNQHYGPTTVENGYAVAKVIVDNQLVDGTGGGVCQISSTLYNAVLKAELDVVERRNHSLPVSYVPLGFDATLANPYIDFKFKNNQTTPVLVTATLNNGVADVSIYGQEVHNAGRTLSFRSKTISSTKAGEKTVQDPTLEVGEKVFDVKPLDGKVVESYKDVYENGKLVETIFLSKSTYPKRDAVVKVGTKPVAQKTVDQPVETQEQLPKAQN